MLIAATAAAAAANSVDVKNATIDCAAASPVLTRSPSLQSTATASALPSAQAQGYPLNRTSLCKLQAGNSQITTLEAGGSSQCKYSMVFICCAY